MLSTGSRHVVVNIAVACLGLFIAWYSLLNHDVGGMFSYAERLLAGKQFYVDVYQVNTPFMTYMLMPLVMLQEAAGIAYTDSFFVFYGFVFFLCVCFSLYLLSFFEIFKHPESRLAAGLMLSSALLLFPSLEKNFGQREHFLMCLIFPYVVTLMARDYKVGLPTKYRFIAGLLAGIGFCIKPNFIILFICAELTQIIMRRNIFACFRVESMTIGFLYALYFLTFLIAFPEYWQQLFFILDAYKKFQSNFLLVLAKMIFTLSGFYFYIVVIIKFKSDLSKLASIFSLSIGAALHYLVQGFPFSYFLIPVFTLLLWLGAVLLVNAQKSKYVLWMVLLAALPHSLNLLSLNDRRLFISDLTTKVTQHATREPVAVLSTSVYPAFPVIDYSETIWPLPLPHMLQVIAYHGTNREQSQNSAPVYRDLEQMDKTERYFTSRYLYELEKRPKLVIIDEQEHKQGLENTDFNILSYFLAQERFRVLWKDYRYIGTLHDFAFYKYEPAAKP